MTARASASGGGAAVDGCADGAPAARTTSSRVDLEASSRLDDRLQVGVMLYPGFRLLDVAGAEAVLAPAGRVHLLASSRTPLASDSGVQLSPTFTFAGEPPRLDVLFVPGGLGARAATEDRDFVGVLGRTGFQARYVTSAGAGALLLAAASLLEGYKAAAHGAQNDEVVTLDVPVVRRRVVTDRNRVTGGGVTAGIDVGLALLAALKGETAAKLTRLMLEYDPPLPFCTGSSETTGADLPCRACASLAHAEAPFPHETAPSRRLRGILRP